MASLVIGLSSSIAWISIGGSLEILGLIFHDYLQRTFPAQSAGKVALILLDDSTVKELLNQTGESYPYQRVLFADVIESAKLLGAKAVGLDVIFSEQSARGQEDDEDFAKAIENAGFPVVVVSERSSSGPFEILRRSKNISWGHTHTKPSVDGVFRNLEMDGETFSSKLATGPHSGWIHFGPPDGIPKVPLWNVTQARFKPDLKRELSEKLQNKIWIVGYSARGLFDIKPNPINANASGAELSANLVAEVLSGGSGVKISTTKIYLALCLSLFLIWQLLLFVFNPNQPTSLLVLSIGLSLVGPFACCAGAWVFCDQWLDPLAIVCGLALGTGFHFAYKVRRDWADRRKFARAIHHSMSPQMLKLIENGDVEVRRYGERREIVVMFADLSGFTTMSEQLTPEMLVNLMNDYLDHAVELVINDMGYVDKFIGDAIMALWGAPVKIDGGPNAEADAALKTALGFADVTDACKKRWKQKYGLDLSVATRVGIHLGEAVVGNLGSHDRFNYTALGDTVNLASRLEGVGKYYHQYITVSGEVIARASSELAARFFLVDEVAVKGKENATKIYSTKGGHFESDLMAYRSGFEAYQRKEWQEAINYFKKAELAGIGPAKVLLERCESLKLGSDTKRFDNGIWRLDEK